MTSADKRSLRPGDVVEVRSAAEILATLDDGAALDRMPFMPEMVGHVQRRYKVTRRVDKICDTIAATGSRRMHATVYLEGLRCDGSGHGGCQAGCKIYWKEAWLRRVVTIPARANRATGASPTLTISRKPGRGPCVNLEASGLKSGAARQPKRSVLPRILKRLTFHNTGAS